MCESWAFSNACYYASDFVFSAAIFEQWIRMRIDLVNAEATMYIYVANPHRYRSQQDSCLISKLSKAIFFLSTLGFVCGILGFVRACQWARSLNGESPACVFRLIALNRMMPSADVA